MGNCIFCYPDRTLKAAIAPVAGSTAWSLTLPLTNLQNRLKSKVARSAGVTIAHTKFVITLPTLQPVRMVSIINHNASKAASVTLKYSAIAAGGSELGIATGLPFWGSYYPPETPLEWSEDEYWGGTLCDADAYDYKPSPDLWYVLPQVISAKYITVEISDTANPAGYFQLGRCFVANGFQPTVNMDYGVAMSWQQDVLREQTVGGVEWFEVRSAGREISGTLSSLSIAEGMVQVFDRQRRLGLEGELYFIYDPADTLLLYKQRAMLARFADADPLKYPYLGKTSSSFNLKEVR